MCGIFYQKSSKLKTSPHCWPPTLCQLEPSYHNKSRLIGNRLTWKLWVGEKSERCVRWFSKPQPPYCRQNRDGGNPCPNPCLHTDSLENKPGLGCLVPRTRNGGADLANLIPNSVVNESIHFWSTLGTPT